MNRKYSDDDRLIIIHMAQCGRPTRHIAKQLKVHPKFVARVLSEAGLGAAPGKASVLQDPKFWKRWRVLLAGGMSKSAACRLLKDEFKKPRLHISSVLRAEKAQKKTTPPHKKRKYRRVEVRAYKSLRVNEG